MSVWTILGAWSIFYWIMGYVTLKRNYKLIAILKESDLKEKLEKLVDISWLVVMMLWPLMFVKKSQLKK